MDRTGDVIVDGVGLTYELAPAAMKLPWAQIRYVFFLHGMLGLVTPSAMGMHMVKSVRGGVSPFIVREAKVVSTVEAVQHMVSTAMEVVYSCPFILPTTALYLDFFTRMVAAVPLREDLCRMLLVPLTSNDREAVDLMRQEGLSHVYLLYIYTPDCCPSTRTVLSQVLSHFHIIEGSLEVRWKSRGGKSRRGEEKKREDQRRER